MRHVNFPYHRVNQGYTPATQAGLYRGGPLYMYYLNACNDVESPEHGRSLATATIYRMYELTSGTLPIIGK